MLALYTQALPNTKNLTRKIEICKHLIEVFKVVEPGISRLQGIFIPLLHAFLIPFFSCYDVRTTISRSALSTKEIQF